MSKLSHFDKDGKAAMVDVSNKSHTHRTAIAKGRIQMKAETLRLIADGSVAKGDVLGAARIAGNSARDGASLIRNQLHGGTRGLELVWQRFWRQVRRIASVPGQAPTKNVQQQSCSFE